MIVQSWKTDVQWSIRLERDRERVDSLIPERLKHAHVRVVERARTGAVALLLTGSTARGQRTPISDLDYLLIGRAIETNDLPDELDVHVVSPEQLPQRLVDGDDFTQWSLRFGRVIFDDGTVRDGMRRIADERLWPDVDRKEQQARRSLQTALEMVASEDRDAAIEQVRTALTLAARWRLLAVRQFPLSRAELPEQLTRLGHSEVATGLATTIYDGPSLPSLARILAHGLQMMDAPREVAVAGSRSHAA